jgi:hypothetical protein
MTKLPIKCAARNHQSMRAAALLSSQMLMLLPDAVYVQ